MDAVHCLRQLSGDDTDRCRSRLESARTYSVHRRTLYSVLSTQSVPIATHLAETQDELELLRNHAGPFVDFLKELNVWDPTGLILNESYRCHPYIVIAASSCIATISIPRLHSCRRKASSFVRALTRRSAIRGIRFRR